ncbi:50S ribosomal protein L35 [Candidatus Uhrbacteria bacterium CG_4_9_14_0_2_um_filter_41_50]|uniref:50S ribosomal protein L35 n=1 Tax=Candidatus Uhrbacteria bacterium CG_4_9_14_0_2_um_filter_41_50 TaxID=1975031 RepID=A0A2M8EPV9_9BACT|nr:MAG: 50S ribosomal protein L35 [Candidatus Uhrbacteria bacterium CG_4_10_14_3_um_filter_41_21]PIZ55302.1 MAG: 50S ribosomal protein L35 [Candidatus Uhrbacteria bacterium CG_4_10_14_0_2_um_filter_41_21]PJB84541.1 MAG: 50S ribosomal protein L35 [Candidatus Uhrbacteria bacterium CG_4_9_14_0_8_um_filter_41_16]PJC24731.1 MAG: 50S ribosomal protein L35 [Candidatus Uhrbacteria bacterium CG_4_9_14_0_2_um_filter_41_50]PJE74906.1 MAG: 50S ribosomal protein L35 [Candidatus Uhrbacteria bacterium CG10_bi
MKLKTTKALVKRIKITKTGKQIKRKAGQDHFNSRENGNTKRNKRSDLQIHHTLRKAVKALTPNK